MVTQTEHNLEGVIVKKDEKGYITHIVAKHADTHMNLVYTCTLTNFDEMAELLK